MRLKPVHGLSNIVSKFMQLQRLRLSKEEPRPLFKCLTSNKIWSIQTINRKPKFKSNECCINFGTGWEAREFAKITHGNISRYPPLNRPSTHFFSS